MANHKSALKRIRQNDVRKVRNRYYAKTMRNAIKKYRLLTDKKEAQEQLPKLYSMIDRLAKKDVIHKNKAGNLKSKITKHYNSVLAA
jgi:small subunit ribosomal protein S20